MAVWPFLMALSAATVLASFLSGSGHAIRVSMVILGAYIVTQLSKYLPITGEAHLAVFSAIWVVAFGAISRHTATMAGSVGIDQIAIPVLCAMSALCYFVGRVLGMEPKLWSPPYTASDLLVVLAMVLIWWGVKSELVGRISDINSRGAGVGSTSSFSSFRSSNNQDRGTESGKAGKESEARPASKVRAHG